VRRDRFDTRHFAEALQQARVTIYHRLFRLVAGVSRIDIHHHDAAWIEAGIHRVQFQEAAQNETGADEKNDRDRDLRGGQQLAHAMTRTPPHAASSRSKEKRTLPTT